jgi:hypothetical protein
VTVVGDASALLGVDGFVVLTQRGMSHPPGGQGDLSTCRSDVVGHLDEETETVTVALVGGSV